VEQELARIASNSHGVVSRAQLLRAGVTVDEIRHLSGAVGTSDGVLPLMVNRAPVTQPAPRPTQAQPAAPTQRDSASQRADGLRNCRGQARSTMSLSAEAQQKTERICDAAAGGSVAQIRRAARAACIVVVEDTTKKGSSERAARLEDCGLIA
jgi:hypothetical protein